MSARLSRRGTVADAYQAAAGLSIISYTESSWDTNAATTRSATGISVLNGDLLVVFNGQEDTSGTLGNPTATGVTFTSRQTNNTSNNCKTGAFTGPITTDNASLTVQCTCPTDKGAGIGVFVLRGGAYGTSTKEVNTTEAPALDLTATKAGSIGLYIVADWNASDGSSRTWRTINSIVGTERTYFRNSARWAVYVGSWSNLGATGTKTFGLSAPSGMVTSQIAVEITTP